MQASPVVGPTSTMRTCTNPRGQRIRGVNPNRTDSRASGYRAAGSRFMNASGGGNAGGLPALATHDRSNPRGSTWV